MTNPTTATDNDMSTTSHRFVFQPLSSAPLSIDPALLRHIIQLRSSMLYQRIVSEKIESRLVVGASNQNTKTEVETLRRELEATREALRMSTEENRNLRNENNDLSSKLSPTSTSASTIEAIHHSSKVPATEKRKASRQALSSQAPYRKSDNESEEDSSSDWS